MRQQMKQIKLKGVTTITAIQPDTIKKAEAKRAIDEVAKAKKQEIDNNTNATKEEKDVAKSKVDEEVTKLKVLLIKQLLMTKLTKVIIMVIQLLLLFNLKQLKPEAKQAIDEAKKI